MKNVLMMIMLAMLLTLGACDKQGKSAAEAQKDVVEASKEGAKKVAKTTEKAVENIQEARQEVAEKKVEMMQAGADELAEKREELGEAQADLMEETAEGKHAIAIQHAKKKFEEAKAACGNQSGPAHDMCLAEAKRQLEKAQNAASAIKEKGEKAADMVREATNH